MVDKRTDDEAIPLMASYKVNELEHCDMEKAITGEDSFTPYLFDGTTSFFNTTFNGLNALSGAGFLSIPYALASGGWLSLILMFIIASATFYTGLLIKRCMDFDPSIRRYPDIGDRAFGAKGRILVSVFMHLELYLVATGFLILSGDNLHNLMPNAKIDIYGFIIGGRQTFVVLVALVMMPTVMIYNMATLSYVSATGVLASIVILCSVLWGGISDGIGFRQEGTLVNWSGLPTSISLYAFCYCAHPVFPTLYTSMRNQKRFSSVLLLCFVFSTITYASMAILGYLMFGSKLQSQITLNLPVGKISSKVAIYTALVNPIAKYSLMLKPIIDAIENITESSRLKRFHSLFVRTSLVSSSVLVALTVPFFGDLMSLVGAFLSVTASILIPCFCYLKISRDYRKLGFEVVIIWFTVSIGFVIMVSGTYTSLVQIISKGLDGNEEEIS